MLGQDQRVSAVIQARAGSTRLPGKVFAEIGGKPALAWVVDAAQSAAGIDDVVVATSDLPGDDCVAERASQLGAQVVRGSESDVLSRFVMALDATGANAVVRLTADCPFLDPLLMSQVVACWRSDPSLDYVATTLYRTLPRGLDVELAAGSALRSLMSAATGHDRVHVTSALYTDAQQGRPTPFHLAGLTVAPRADHYRVTLDTSDDLLLLRALAELLPTRPPAWRDVVAILDDNPQLVALNSHVQQKALADG